MAGGRLLVVEALRREGGGLGEGGRRLADVLEVLCERLAAGEPQLGGAGVRRPLGRVGEGVGELLPGVRRRGEAVELVLEGDVTRIGDQGAGDRRPRAAEVLGAALVDPRGLGEDAGAAVVVGGEAEARLDEVEEPGGRR